MSLPKIEHVTFKTELPSNNNEIIFRPFLVKEEKILLIALQSEDSSQIISAIKQIIKNCVVVPENLNVDKLSIFDLEHLFLQLRIHSISDKVELNFSARDENFTDCKECLSQRTVEVNLQDVKVQFNEKNNNKIEINENLGFVLKYPNFSIMEKLNSIKSDSEVSLLFEVFWNCIDFIYQEDKNIDPKDYTKEEGIEFLESLPAKSLEKIQNFFDTMPKLKHEIKIKCGSCDFEQDYSLEGLDDFFG
jgi:hypothetical protein